MSQNKEFEQKKPTVATETDSLSRGCMLLGQAGADQSKKMVRVQKIGTFILHSRGFGAHSQHHTGFCRHTVSVTRSST